MTWTTGSVLIPDGASFGRQSWERARGLMHVRVYIRAGAPLVRGVQVHQEMPKNVTQSTLLCRCIVINIGNVPGSDRTRRVRSFAQTCADFQCCS